MFLFCSMNMSNVGPPIIGDDDPDDDDGEVHGQIKGVLLLDSEDGGRFAAYGPVDEAQDECFNPTVTEINADSYAWMSLDALRFGSIGG
jgi:hypothetical protein